MKYIKYIKYESIFTSLKKYGYCSRIETKCDPIDVSTATSSFAILGKSWIEMDLKFQDHYHLEKFVDDLSSIDEEEYIRSRNPTVQRAYEEYQLLLKLSA